MIFLPLPNQSCLIKYRDAYPFDKNNNKILSPTYRIGCVKTSRLSTSRQEKKKGVAIAYLQWNGSEGIFEKHYSTLECILCIDPEKVREFVVKVGDKRKKLLIPVHQSRESTTSSLKFSWILPD